MNFNQRIDHRANSCAEAAADLDFLLERCRSDLKVIDELLHQIENRDASCDSDQPGRFAGNHKRSGSNEIAANAIQGPVVSGTEAVRRLTANIEALSLAPFRSDVQPVLQAMHDNMVRCLKLVPAQRQN